MTSVKIWAVLDVVAVCLEAKNTFLGSQKNRGQSGPGKRSLINFGVEKWGPLLIDGRKKKNGSITGVTSTYLYEPHINSNL